MWIAYTIRRAAFSLLAGNVIPFAVLPWGLGNVLSLLPFGSLGGAALSVYSGTASPLQILPVQLLWNLILWPVTILIFRKSQERMVSHGG